MPARPHITHTHTNRDRVFKPEDPFDSVKGVPGNREQDCTQSASKQQNAWSPDAVVFRTCVRYH